MKYPQSRNKRIALLIMSCIVGIAGITTAYKAVTANKVACGPNEKNATAEGDQAGREIATQNECAQKDGDNKQLFVGCNGFF